MNTKITHHGVIFLDHLAQQGFIRQMFWTDIGFKSLLLLFFVIRYVQMQNGVDTYSVFWLSNYRYCIKQLFSTPQPLKGMKNILCKE